MNFIFTRIKLFHNPLDGTPLARRIHSLKGNNDLAFIIAQGISHLFSQFIEFFFIVIFNQTLFGGFQQFFRDFCLLPFFSNFGLMVRKFLKRLQNILCKALVAVLFILAINDKPVIGESVAQVLQGIVLFLIAPIQTMQFMPVLFRGINLVQPFLQ